MKYIRQESRAMRGFFMGEVCLLTFLKLNVFASMVF